MAWNCIEVTNLYTPYRRQTLLAFALTYHGSLALLPLSGLQYLLSRLLKQSLACLDSSCSLASDLLLTWILVFAHSALWFLVVFSDENFPT